MVIVHCLYCYNQPLTSIGWLQPDGDSDGCGDSDGRIDGSDDDNDANDYDAHPDGTGDELSW